MMDRAGQLFPQCRITQLGVSTRKPPLFSRGRPELAAMAGVRQQVAVVPQVNLLEHRPSSFSSLGTGLPALTSSCV